MAKKLIPLTINRSRWVRGNKGGMSSLLNEQDNMCCLGFACRKLGLTREAIDDRPAPDDIASDDAISDTRFNYLLDKLSPLVRVTRSTGQRKMTNRAATDAAMEINDDTLISEEEREKKLIPILKKLGFAVKFVGAS